MRICAKDHHPVCFDPNGASLTTAETCPVCRAIAAAKRAEEVLSGTLASLARLEAEYRNFEGFIRNAKNVVLHTQARPPQPAEGE